MSPKKSLTATNLAVHQHLSCDLYIHNVYHRHPSILSEGADPTATSELTKAQFKRGLDWEATLYGWLDDSGLLLKVPAIPLSNSADSLLENILADERAHFFITGLSFWPPQAKLTERYEEARTTPLHFGLAKPDLIEIRRSSNVIQWRVLDAKASKNVKARHSTSICLITF